MDIHRSQHASWPRAGLFRAGFLGLTLLISCLAGMAPLVAQAADAPSPRFFAEATGHTVGSPFLDAWIAADGAQSLGNPVTEPVQAGAHTVQYRIWRALAEVLEDHASGGGLSAL